MPSFIDKGTRVKIIDDDSGDNINSFDKDGSKVKAFKGNIQFTFDGGVVADFLYATVISPTSADLSQLVDKIQAMIDNEPFQTDASDGEIGISAVNFDVDTSLETVWSEGGLYTFPVAASTMTVSSDSINDIFAGPGLQTLRIEGLDAAFNSISEEITLVATTPVATVNSYLRINKLVGLTAGTGTSNIGTVYIGTGAVVGGVPANVFNVMNPGISESQTGVYTVPAGKEIEIKDIVLQSQSNKEINFRFYFSDRTINNPSARASIDLTLQNLGDFNHPFQVGSILGEKTDFHLTSFANAGSSNALAIALIKANIRNNG